MIDLKILNLYSDIWRKGQPPFKSHHLAIENQNKILEIRLLKRERERCEWKSSKSKLETWHFDKLFIIYFTYKIKYKYKRKRIPKVKKSRGSYLKSTSIIKTIYEQNNNTQLYVKS